MLNEVFNWFKVNRLSLNCAKSKIFCFGTAHQLKKCDSLVVECDGVQLEQDSSYKYLGVMVDSKLSFKDNAEYIYIYIIPSQLTTVVTSDPIARPYSI